MLVLQADLGGAQALRERGQRNVLRDALQLLTENTRPGQVVTREYPDYGEQYEPPTVGG